METINQSELKEISNSQKPWLTRHWSILAHAFPQLTNHFLNASVHRHTPLLRRPLFSDSSVRVSEALNSCRGEWLSPAHFQGPNSSLYWSAKPRRRHRIRRLPWHLLGCSASLRFELDAACSRGVRSILPSGARSRFSRRMLQLQLPLTPMRRRFPAFQLSSSSRPLPVTVCFDSLHILSSFYLSSISICTPIGFFSPKVFYSPACSLIILIHVMLCFTCMKY